MSEQGPQDLKDALQPLRDVLTGDGYDLDWALSPANTVAVKVIRGMADELLDRLVKLDGLNQPHLTIADGIAAQAFDISAYKIAADELVVGSGARILFHAMAVGAVMSPPGGLRGVAPPGGS